MPFLLVGRWWTSCLVGIILLIKTARAQTPANDSSPCSHFKSRPDLHPPIVDFPLLRPELVEPGYIFVAPYHNLDPGPYIYDTWGNLIWSGAGWSGPRTVHAPRPCEFRGEPHLCFFTGTQHQGFSRGHGIIMDKHYRTVKVIEAYGSGTTSDMHEFKMTPYSGGTSVLMTVYQPRQYDLMTHPKFNIRDGMGWIVEGVFQEIEIETGRLLFEWRSLDHVDPLKSWTWPHSTDTSGDGSSEWHPWDYFHLNSIDKNEEGDYLLSARHTSAIYKISGKNGSVIWQLGGTDSHFDQDFVFSYQHHARWMSENETHTVFSMYDNGANGPFNSTSEVSHGCTVAIDHVAMKATKLMEWGAPDERGGVRAGSQGSMQILPGGNAFIGWGEKFFFSEHTADGEPVAYGIMAYAWSNVPSYRNYKANWTGAPLTPPAIWAYSKEGQDKMVFYTSWNGDTEARSYNFFLADNASGPWQYAGSSERHGFETILNIDGFGGWAYSQAVDANGNILGESAIAKTFVPSERLRPYCDDGYCQFGEPINDDEESFVPFDQNFDITTNDYRDGLMSTQRGFDVHKYYHPSVGDYGDSDNGFISPSKSPYDPSTPRPTGQPSRYECPPQQYYDYPDDIDIGSSKVVLIVGMVLGFVIAMVASCLNSMGVLSCCNPFVNRMSRRAFGFKYQRIRWKDTDSMDSTSTGDHIPL